MSQTGRLRWFVIAFLVAGTLMSGLLAWQLSETSPAKWCIIAKAGSPQAADSCVSMLMKLLEIKDHVVIGLLIIVGLSVLSLAAVALNVKLGINGPGGLSANIDSESVNVQDNQSGSSVTVTREPQP